MCTVYFRVTFGFYRVDTVHLLLTSVLTASNCFTTTTQPIYENTLCFSLLQLIAHLFREQSKKRLKQQHKNNYCPGSINLSQEFIAHIFRTYLQFLPQPFPCCVVGLPSQSQECVDKSVIHYCLTISLFQKKQLRFACKSITLFQIDFLHRP